MEFIGPFIGHMVNYLQGSECLRAGFTQSKSFTVIFIDFRKIVFSSSSSSLRSKREMEYRDHY